ncbi:MAG: class I SAM-dependent methyltransferase [Hyphomicrobium aestuarii]|nr:class I SAM-dependent methyltransferase [Hyphomicrobium aestuarii]
MPYNLSIPGQVSEHQLKAIEAVAALVPKNGKVVEVGSLFGCSSWAWAKSVDPSVTVYCIDPWEKNEGVRSMEARLGITYGIEQFKKHTADCPNITALQGYSPVHFLDWSDPIDLYYEDAVHNDPILGQNLDFWSARLKPTGIICGDDYRPRFPDVMNGAKRLADRFQRAFIRVDFFWCLLPNDSVLPGAAAVAIRLKELSAEHDALKRGRGPVFYIGPRMPIEPVAEGASTVVTCRVSNESLDPWPTEASKPHIIASVRVTSEAEPDFVLAEVRQPLPVTQLAPDVPVDYRIGLPTATLAAGNYRLVFDMVGPDGAYAASNNAARAPHSALAVLQAGAVAEAGSPTTPTLTAGPGASSSTGKRRPLIDTDVAQRELTSTAFADSHGAFSRHLGAGMLYYALGHLVRSQVSVCIGSGGGFVPSLMRRAQLDADIAPAITYLIDANLPDLAFGSPVQAGGWMTVENKFLDRERDIVVLPMLSVDAAALLAHNNILVDYLHIDGDHSAKGVLSDFQAFAPLLSAHAVVSLHDLRMPGVDQALTAILAAQPDLEMIGFREIGNGTGVLRRRGALDVPRRPQTVADLGDLSRKTSIDPVGVQTAIDDSNHRSRFERWSYLDTPTYQTRYRLVTDWIDRPGEAIVEIGGYPNSIVHFAKNATAVHAIEPYTTAVFEARFKDAATQNGILAMLHRMAVGSLSLDSSGFVPFNLVALGLDITSGARTPSEITASLQRLLELIGKAQRVALEACLSP